MSLEEPYRPAFAPRRRAWWSRAGDRPPHLLLLFREHKRGQGAAHVIRQQSVELFARGFRVTVGGPISDLDLDYPGCFRLDVSDQREATIWAARNDVDVVIAHTCRFFSAARWSGYGLPLIACDHDDPPPEAFSDAAARKAEKGRSSC